MTDIPFIFQNVPNDRENVSKAYNEVVVLISETTTQCKINIQSLNVRNTNICKMIKVLLMEKFPFSRIQENFTL